MTAFTSIQLGVAAACYENGGQVWVAEGTYTSTTDPVVTMVTGVRLYGGFVGTETSRNQRNWTEHETIIDGEDTRRGVMGASYATLNGFTVTRGYATEYGGGMYNNSSSPTVANCTFSGNSATGDYGIGGGMSNVFSSPLVINCMFLGNMAAAAGGMANLYAGSPTVTNCRFSGNSATGDNGIGGGMASASMPNYMLSLTVTNCTFSGNTADGGGGMYNGDYCSATVTNCTFIANSADDVGGGMVNENYGGFSSQTVKNCTFSANSAGNYGSGMFNESTSSPTLTNCILWDATPDEIYNYGSSTVTVTYSCVQMPVGVYPGAGNIAVDPSFVDAGNGDLRLNRCSPCIDTGTSDGAPLADILGVTRPQGAGFDMGAYERITESLPPIDPSDPGSMAIGVDTITWTWQDNSCDETGFKVYDDPGAVPPVTLRTTTAADVELWQHNGLNVNTQYAFQVAATNANGVSALTPNFTAWTLAAVPVAPMVGIPDFHSLYVAILGFDGNPASTLYAIQVSPAVGGNTWVQADGTVGASAVYNTAIGWFFVFVTGLDDATTYAFQVIARNGAGVDTAPGPAGIGTTLTLLEVTQQPVGGSAYVGDSFTLAVVASGVVPPLSYQWRHDGSSISEATNTDLVLNPLALGDAGDYDCVVTDSGLESVTSDVATLNVADHLAITTQPEGDTLNLGDPYTLFVGTDGGHLPLTYRWIKDGTDILDATESSYEIAAFAGTDAGAYTVVVHDNFTDEETSDPPALLELPPMPVAGLAGLAAAVLAAGLLGALRLRRRTR